MLTDSSRTLGTILQYPSSIPLGPNVHQLVILLFLIRAFRSCCIFLPATTCPTTRLSNNPTLLIYGNTANIQLVSSPFVAEKTKLFHRSLVHHIASSSTSQHQAEPVSVAPGQGLGWWWWPLFLRYSSHPGCPPTAAIYENMFARIPEL